MSRSMSAVGKIKEFVEYAKLLRGDEKGEAQVFCDRLFQAFGHDGYKEAGATLEYRVKRGKTTLYADLLWKPRLLLEMKSRGEQLQKHYDQAFEYWLNSVPQRPRYVVLCNFDEFWIYDFDSQLRDPVDRLGLDDLVQRYTALNFLFPDDPRPQFGNDRIAVTRAAAEMVAAVFNSLVARGVEREAAQRFILQSVVAMFAEDIDLIPRGLFTALIYDGVESGNAYDLFAGIFHQMNRREQANAGRFKGVPYFNGGLFARPEPLELTKDELTALGLAASENWARVEPPIFGTLFQSSMGKDERHVRGAHFTSESEIQRVVLPTIVRPWRERIRAAKSAKKLFSLREELLKFRVLDPACGSGNFLYVAYRELKRLEFEILTRLHDYSSVRKGGKAGVVSYVSIKQFFGIDIVPFATELAKVTLMLGKKLAIDEASELAGGQRALPLEMGERSLPLENLDDNIIYDDALLCEWPPDDGHADAIIGNPPYQSKNKMQQEFGPAYVNEIRSRYPGVPGRADYAVFWFRRAHDELLPGQRAGLVGTNTIRQNYSRQGGLDYIVKNDGTIVEAVSSQVWPGVADVHVSIVNWVKGEQEGKKKLFSQDGDNFDSPWSVVELDTINSQLSAGVDVTSAVKLKVNVDADVCDQGQTHGHKGFLVSREEALKLLDDDPRNGDVLHPYLIGDELLRLKEPVPPRYVIDFHRHDMAAAGSYESLFDRIKSEVLPDRKRKAKEEEERNRELLEKKPKARVNRHHRNFLKRWWQLSYARKKLIEKLEPLPRYLVCCAATKRPIFEFVCSSVRPNAQLIVFVMADDYSFGILQSSIHWSWFTARCSTLTARFRYTSETVFDSFPWPQKPTQAKVRRVAKAAVELRKARRALMKRRGWSLRELYKTEELPGRTPLTDVQDELDRAVRSVYGMKKSDDVLEFLLKLNRSVAIRENGGETVMGPGLPALIKKPSQYVSKDCFGPI